MRLKEKVAIVTGGSKGIGKAVADLFAQEGAQVIIWDVAIAESDHQFAQVNVASLDEVQAATQDVIKDFGRIDILINNAGITMDKTLVKMEPKEWHQLMEVNLTGVFNCTKAVAAHMKSQEYGRIISATSVVGLKGGFGQGNYAASKAGVIGMTKSWAMELAKHHVTVNCVAPGYIKTDMTDAIPNEVKSVILSHVPAGRIGTPEEVAKAYLFLASDEAAYITGVTLPVDGGITRY